MRENITEATQALAARVWADWLTRAPAIELHAANASHVASRSLGDAQAAASAAGTFLRDVAQLRTQQPDTASVVTLDYLEWLLETWQDAPRRHLYEFPVSPYTSSEHLVDSVRAFETFELGSAGDADDYVALAVSYRDYVVELQRTLEHQVEAGIVIPLPAQQSVWQCVAGMRDLACAAMRVDPSRRSRLTSAQSARLEEAVTRVVDGEIVPAFGRLKEYLTGPYAARQPAAIGFGQYPGGEEYYRSAAELWTTSSRSIEDMHAIGLEQVDELTVRMEQVRRELGFSGTHRDFQAKLRSRPRLVGSSPSDVRSLYHRRVERALPLIEPLFGHFPTSAWAVERLDPALEPGMTFGYYSHPTPSHPVGTYYFNGSNLESRLLIGAQALMLHELLPGHHLQIGLQVENHSLPAIRREPVLSISAFIEGWGEYAAGLGWELGLYDDPYDKYGRLSNELFLSQRLVLDTGLNALGWTAERAAEYMHQGTTLSDPEITSEILRYAADFPAQALAYRLGYLELGELRRKATEALGDQFDLPAFHSLILDEGALPLSVVAKNVDRWIGEQQA